MLSNGIVGMLNLPYQRFQIVFDAVVGASLALPITKAVPTDGFFLLRKLYGTRTDPRIGYKLFDTDLNYSWSNMTYIDHDNIFGTLQYPNQMRDPIIFSPNADITIEALDFSGAPNTVQLVLDGYRLFGEVAKEKLTKERWFQYAITKDLIAGQLTTDAIHVNTDSDFLIKRLMARSTGTFQTRTGQSYYGSRTWSEVFVNNANEWGTAQLPNEFIDPNKASRNSSINIELKDTSAAPNRVQLVFEGVKRWA